MRLDDLRQELEALAVEAPPAPHDARAVMRPAVRRMWTRRALAAFSALAVGVSAVVAMSHVQSHHRELTISSPSGPSTETPTTTMPAVPALSAATIADGQWKTIAPFPLAARRDESVVWTGAQMIVWGGDNVQRVFGDGATYDPGANTWRVMPPAPIAGRTMAAAVWTGHEMIVWGGDRAYVGNYANDGAAFDPVTWKWRHIAPSPLAPRYAPHGLWTGNEIIVVGGSETNSNSSIVLDAAAYDPATDHWRRIASLPNMHGATIEDLQLVWTGSEILAWEFWTRTAGSLTTRRLQPVQYDPTTGVWQNGPTTDDPHRNVYGPIWTGHDVITPAAPPLCDLPDGAQNCGPPPTNLHASEFDPVTGSWRSIPHGPADVAASASVWTGADLVVLGGGAIDGSTGKTTVQPGTAAAWNPHANAWTPLPPAPYIPFVDAAVWTGREILIWGNVTVQPGGALADRGLRYGLTSNTPSVGPLPSDISSLICSNATTEKVTSIEYVATTERRETQVLNTEDGNTNTPVWVIEMRGAFTAAQAPPGGPAPRGTVATATYDRTTHASIGSGIVNQYHDLQILGPVGTLTC